MSKDISPILEGWSFQPDEISVRKIKGVDGRWKLQLRLDLGLIQMELSGRPDGSRPNDHESLLEYYKALAAKQQLTTGTDKNFHLNTSDCQALQREALQYYHRYISCFQLQEYQEVCQDTHRNLEVIDFVKRYAVNEYDIFNFEQFRPYILMMNTRALANLSLSENNYHRAITQVKTGIQKIKAFFESYGQAELMEQSMELQFLEKWLKELSDQQPVNLIEKLQRELKEAVDHEKFEHAAVLRDQLNTLLGK
ncbi:UvrB/UvrC motif-containing protein [candidate division KSB1 bacterium]|nr:UvrB/UvrC motif-containing protein [candidate division KSB1 bacterium]